MSGTGAYDPCPDYAGHWLHLSTGCCSCGHSHSPITVDEAKSKMVRAFAARALEAAADEIEAELICCDAYDGNGAQGTHAICYWAGAARALVLARAADLRKE